MNDELKDLMAEAFRKSGFPKNEKMFTTCFNNGYGNGVKDALEIILTFVNKQIVATYRGDDPYLEANKLAHAILKKISELSS